MRESKIFVFLAPLLLFSCVLPESTHVAPDFFLLSSIGTENDDNFSGSNMNHSFYLKEVEVPEYLKESRMVSRPDSVSIEFRELQRWGEPIADGIGRVLSLNLSRNLDTYYFSIFPNRRKKDVVWEIAVSMVRFERFQENKVRIEALWDISDGGHVKKHGVFRSELLIDKSAGYSVRSEVRALDACLEGFAKELSAVISAQDSGNLER